jgi:hypothetical protein
VQVVAGVLPVIDTGCVGSDVWNVLLLQPGARMHPGQRALERWSLLVALSVQEWTCVLSPVGMLTVNGYRRVV